MIRHLSTIAALLCFISNPSAEKIAEPIHQESMLAQTREFERSMETSGSFFEDPVLTAYLNEVLHNLCTNEPDNNRFQVRVLKFSSFNAFATPHGTIYLCTPLLARIENEAQLAALLSHEITHVINGHASRGLTNIKKQALANAHLQIGLDFFIGSLAGSIGSAAIRSAVTGYSRELEREADSLGLIRMSAMGYAPEEFRNFFLILKNYIESEDIKQPFFFATHPAITERISNYYALIGKNSTTASAGKKEPGLFTRIITNVLLTEGIAASSAGKFDLAGRIFSRVIETDSCNGDALIALGNNLRLQSLASIEPRVMEWYHKAYQCDKSFDEALRELGLYYFKNRQEDSASYYLELYKTRSPASPYLPLIEEYLQQCKK